MTTNLILTSTANTDASRAKATESTGTDPGPFTYRLHRDSCDRMRAGDEPTPVFNHDTAELNFSADIVSSAKACTRCAPKDVAGLKAWAREAEVADASEQLADTPAEDEPVRIGDTVTATVTTTTPQEAPVYDGEQPPVYAGPAATRHADGRVLGLTAALYPEVHEDVTLYCPGHNAFHEAKAFRYLTKKGSGDGRPVECRKAQSERLAANKALRSNGEAPVPAPRLDAAHVAPRG